jgi:hypothetical protein
MTGSNVDHKDVGAYALGVLSPWEAEQFEIHLAGCSACAAELEELTLVSTLLSHVDADDLATVEEFGREGRTLDRMLNVVSFERRRARTRRVLAAAAAVVVIVAGVAFGLTGLRSPETSKAPVAKPTQSSGGVGIFGQPGGEKLNGTNPTTGTTATMKLISKGWGTEVGLELTKVDGPLTCRLVAISKSGQSDVAMTWSVPRDGYGTAAQPNPLTLQGGTALKREDIERFEVRTTDGSLDGTTLVSIPAT